MRKSQIIDMIYKNEEIVRSIYGDKYKSVQEYKEFVIRMLKEANEIGIKFNEDWLK